MEGDSPKPGPDLTGDPSLQGGEVPLSSDGPPASAHDEPEAAPRSSSSLFPPHNALFSSSSTTSTASAESTSQLLKGFWKKTVDNTATAHALWRHRLQQHQQQRTTGAAAGGGASLAAAAAAPMNKAPLIQLEQASLSPATSPSNQDAAAASHRSAEVDDAGTETEIVMVKEDQDDESALLGPSVEQADHHDLLGPLHSESSARGSSILDGGDSADSGGRRSQAPSGSSSDDPDDDESNSNDDEEEEEEYNDEDGEDTASYVSSSVYSTSQYGSDTNRLSALQWAAASVVDSVQAGYFRGRYAASASQQQTQRGGATPPSSARGLRAALPRAGGGSGGSSGGVSQTARILGSSHAAHLRELQAKLGPHEYLMFLGKGMLGVNLKQSYLHKVGVYVDYLIPHGAADRSNLIRVGDLLTHVGDTDVRRQTILTVPQQIAAAKRPLHLVWATGTLPGADRLDYVEIAVAHLQRWRSDDSAGTTGDRLAPVSSASSPAASPPASPPRQPHNPQLEAQSPDPRSEEDSHDDEEKKHEFPPSEPADASEPECDASGEAPPEVEAPVLGTLDDLLHPDLPPLDLREAYHDFSAGRNTGVSVLHLCQQAATDENFRSLLQHAFVLCAMDDRRLAFLSRHMGQQEEEDDRPFNSPSALLALFVEMVNYADLYGLTPLPHRKQVANLIAHKFFLPTRLGNELLPPMFDFHQIVPDATLRSLEAALKADIVPRELFADFCFAALESLASHPFVTFLVSPECSRMRAYLRHTALFVRVPLYNVLEALAPTDIVDDVGGTVLVADDPHARNYFSHILLYLLCRTDREGYGEHDDVLATGNGARQQDAAGSLCAALFVRRRLATAVRRARHRLRHPDADSNDGDNSDDDVDCRAAVVAAWERLWEVFVAPHVGALSLAPLSNEAAAYHSQLVAQLRQIQNDGGEFDEVASKLCDEGLLRTAMQLADEIIYGYAVNLHPKFREHKFHEWLCAELAKARLLHEPIVTTAEVPHLSVGCVKRLLQKATFPVGIAPHKPFLQTEAAQEGPKVASHVEQVSAECAVVFGTPVGLSDSQPALMDGSHDALRRYACELMYTGEPPNPNALTLEDVPSTLESYAVVPSALESAPRPFKNYRDGQWISSDGWEVSIVNFRIPRGESADESETSAVFGVSLVLRLVNPSSAIGDRRTRLVFDPAFDHATAASVVETRHDAETLTTLVNVPLDASKFNESLAERPWLQRVSNDSGAPVTLGLTLLSHQNVILAMRDTLIKLLNAFSPSSESFTCGSLADVLGNFAHEDVESCALQAILDSFVRRAANPWMERPIKSQQHSFEQQAGRLLLQSLPPIPLALTFVTALLEQKIVIASSRRSLLLSASEALSKMLHPLRWCHLLVPRVPAALAADLLQYPAPFILGIPSEDAGMIDLIRELPDDVTLVDLDVGRVLLAQSFSHVEFGRGTPNNPKTAKALRSQVLYLAQALGGVFGSVSDPETWCCDRPLSDLDPSDQASPFDRICLVCRDFLKELLAGTAACCYWIEESSSDITVQEPTVIFDEDRFFHIKSMRQRHGFRRLHEPTGEVTHASLAMSLSDFELVLEVLIRCQNMNAYIATCDKETMAYSIHH